MSSGFDELTRRARDLVVAGDLATAQELLGQALADTDPRPEVADPELTDAAGLQARVLLTLGEPHAAHGWALFHHAASTRLYGPSDQRTIAAAATLAAVLHRTGDDPEAALLYRDVVIELTAIDGPESLRVLAAHADLATVEYAQGQCRLARHRLEDAWQLHREVYGDGHPSGIKMLARLGAMERDCGRFDEAHEHLELAREFCRTHLPADHPLAAQIAALSRAPADPGHVCTDVPDPAADGPHPHPHPDATPPQPPPPDDATIPDPEATDREATLHPEQTNPYPTGSDRDDLPGGPEERWWPPDPDPAWPDDPAAFGTAVAGTPPDHGPPPGETTPGGTPSAADDSYWSQTGIGAPYDVGPASGADYPTGGRAWRPEGSTGGVWRPEQSGGTESVGLPAVREPADRRLPAVYRPERSGRRMLPIVLAGAVVVLLGTGAVIAGFALLDDGSPPPRPAASGTAGPAPTTGPPPAPPGSPPTNVTVSDNRQSVTLSWTYPAGAEGPVVVAGGRSGQEPRAFQELPAGSNGFTVYGLNSNQDYCFTVAVVYSADTIGRSPAVCTSRAARSPGR
ncbi:tetratricopeptide repeat protein [Micromonospora zhanjiangensis]|uniref:Tetratricopeptide repeat protein n=1 Tax=Micromonospora zhanjiangensis TaxID=1522057 RepID=A0ABV8KW22_9ACTN